MGYEISTLKAQWLHPGYVTGMLHCTRKYYIPEYNQVYIPDNKHGSPPKAQCIGLYSGI